MTLTTQSQGPAPAALTSSKPFVSAHGRAQAVVFLFLAYVAAALFSIVSNLLQIDFLSGVIAGNSPSLESAASNDTRQAAAAFIHLAVAIALAVAFLLWLWRVAGNMVALGNAASHVEYTPGWAVGSFFIPIVNLFMPYRAVREVWEKSDPAVVTDPDVGLKPAGTSPLVLGWWLTWIAMNVISRAAQRASNTVETPEAMRLVTWAELTSDVIGIVSALLAIRVVRGIDRRQAERALYVAYVPHTPPPPPLPRPPVRLPEPRESDASRTPSSAG